MAHFGNTLVPHEENLSEGEAHAGEQSWDMTKKHLNS